MNISRRRIATALAVLPMSGLSGCFPPFDNLGGKGSVTFTAVQGYIKTIQGFVDKIAPLVETFDPGDAAQIKSVMANVDAAAAAFEALPANGDNAKSIAQTIFTLTNDALSIAEKLPVAAGIPDTVLQAIQLFVIIIGTFYGIAPAAAAGPPAPSQIKARATYDAAPNKAKAAKEADTAVKTWLAR